MNNTATWDDLVDQLRFDERINAGDVSRDLGSRISDAKEAEDQGALTGFIHLIINLLLIRVALKQAFFPDPDEFEDKILEPEYFRPLTALGIPLSPETPRPYELSAERISELLKIVKDYAANEPEPPEITLAEVAGINPRRMDGFSHRVERVFGPENAYALTMEGTLLPMLFRRSTAKSTSEFSIPEEAKAEV